MQSKLGRIIENVITGLLVLLGLASQSYAVISLHITIGDTATSRPGLAALLVVVAAALLAIAGRRRYRLSH